MKSRGIKAAAWALALLLALGWGCAPAPEAVLELPDPPVPLAQLPEDTSARPPEPLNPCNYCDEALLQAHFLPQGYDLPGLSMAIVPHYAPALGMLAGALKVAQADPPQLVILMGPDHEGKGGGVTLSGRGWSTPYGVVEGDADAARLLLADTGIEAAENHALLAQDHSVSTLVPYVAHSLEGSRAVTLLIGKYTSLSRLKALAGAIDSLAQGQSVLVLFSVDFSHYQSPEAAARLDAQTIAAIEDGNQQALLQMDGKNLDSPEAVVVALKLADMWQLQATLADHKAFTYSQGGQAEAGTFMLWAFCRQAEDAD